MYKLHRHEIRLEGGQAMNKEQEEAIERLSSFKTIEILYSNTFAMHIEQLKTLQGDIETVLSMLKEQQEENKKKDKIINLIINEFYKRAKISENCYIQKSKGIEDCLKHKNCKECLKQYFERKVEDVKN